MLIPCDEVNILNTFRVMIILRQLLLLTNLHLKLLSTQGTGADKLLSTQRVKGIFSYFCNKLLYKNYTTLRNLANYLNMNMAEFQSPFTWNMKENSVQPN